MKLLILILSLGGLISSYTQAAEYQEVTLDGDGIEEVFRCYTDPTQGIALISGVDFAWEEIHLKPIQSGKYEQLSTKTVYNQYGNYGDEGQPDPIQTEEKVSYLKNGEPLTSMNLPEADVQDTQNIYNYIKQALQQAQAQGNCLSKNAQDKDLSKVLLDNLNFKTLMKGIYGNLAHNISSADEDEFQGMPYMALGNIAKASGRIAVMHPVKTYQNAQGQERYLIMIEKRMPDNYCAACSVDLDLFAFKKSGHQYQLIAYSHDIHNVGTYGSANIDLNDLKFQTVSSDTVGAFYEEAFGRGGFYEADWYILRISEKGFIEIAKVTDSEGNNAGYYDEGDPNIFGYSSKIGINADGNIEVTYEGTAYDEDEDKIKRIVGLKKIYHYQDKGYVEIQ